ncbi:uncharacterized protein N7518_010424 [Penicillium psychrosexuale]|uniref:uncharacterized protein n=1 Tax=Penicillium psychrosexuale TaxID=1002107 RepID=UPI0025450DB2|nr:uncharacterized protein N7518_010424 [Penicillium psychrosexuale]KAJ5781941.1 hypothetical protein N7518_010424 [Penicillium psychrosexuale]
MNRPSSQDRHEALLQSRTSGQIFWRRLRHSISSNRSPAQALALAGDSPGGDSIGTDMKAIVIANSAGPLRWVVSLPPPPPPSPSRPLAAEAQATVTTVQQSGRAARGLERWLKRQFGWE